MVYKSGLNTINYNLIQNQIKLNICRYYSLKRKKGGNNNGDLRFI